MSKNKIKDIVTIAVITAMLIMESIDANILNVAIPTMARNFMISPIYLKLAITNYLVALAIFIPISGWISDRFGTKNTLLLAISGFCLSSLFCGLSENVYILTIFRFFQGMSGACMVPVARLLMLKAFPKDKLVKVYVVISIPSLIGPLFSPLIGGFLVVHFGWPYIFFVNLPIGIVAFIATYYYVNNYTQKSKIFSFITYFWLALTLSSLIFFLSVVSLNFAEEIKLGLLLIFIISILFYRHYEQNAKYPIINYSLFKIRTFRACFMGNLIMRAAFGGRGFIIALLLQITLKFDPQTSSYLPACAALGLFISSLVIHTMLSVAGFKKVLIMSNLGSSISFILMLNISHITAFAVIIFILNGLFISISFILMNLLCYADVSDNDYAGAVSLNVTIQQLATAVGVLIASYCLELFNFIFKNDFAHITFICSFIILAFISLMAQYYFLRLDTSDGQALSKK